MIFLTQEHQHFDIHTPIGPSPERQRQLQREARERQAKVELDRAKRREEFREGLNEAYGEELVTYGAAYLSGRDNGFVNVPMKGSVRVQEVRDTFSKAFTERLDLQPAEVRARWTAELLENLERYNNFR